MTNVTIPDKKDQPAWAVKAFIHEGKVCYENAKGQTKYANGRFVPGFGGGNPSGLSSDHAKRILKVRSMCLTALETKGLPRIIKELSNKDLSARDLVAIVKFLAETSIPKQIENSDPQDNSIPQIIISREAIELAEERDRQYMSEESGKA